MNDHRYQRFVSVMARPAVEEALRGLPKLERRILRLRFIAGRSVEQVSAQLKMSRVHIRKMEAKSLRNMRNGMVSAVRLQEAG